MKLFCWVFNHSPKGIEVGEQLLTIKQGSRWVAEYALECCIVAAVSRWNKSALKVAFHQGLNHYVLTELACRDEQAILDSLIDLSICLDNFLHNQPSIQGAIVETLSSEIPMPMDSSHTRVTRSEYKQRCKEGLWFYCGEVTHLVAHCPCPRCSRVPIGVERPWNITTPLSVNPSKHLSFNSFKNDILVKLSDSVLIDSGAAGSFMDNKRAQKLQVPSWKLQQPLSIRVMVDPSERGSLHQAPSPLLYKSVPIIKKPSPFSSPRHRTRPSS